MPGRVAPLCLVVLGSLVGLAAAQTTPGDVPHQPWRGSVLPQQWQRNPPPSAALQIPEHITQDDEVQQATLKEVISMALENNPGISARRLEPLRQEQAILDAQALYDPTLTGEAGTRHARLPNASALTGTSIQEQKIDDRFANIHLFKTFRGPGTTASIDFLNDRLDNNAQFIRLKPQYSGGLNFSVAQPLLRNFGWDFSYLVVRVAEQTADAAFYTYKAQLADFVTLVVVAYWNVIRTREQVEVARESKALADRTVEENQARVRVGLFAPVAVLEAQADAASRQEQVLIAENDYAVARQQLAQLVFYRPAGTFVPRTLEPTETPDPEDVPINLDESLATAMASRPEIEASARGVNAQLLNEKIASNALLPRLDVVGSYALNGLAGVNRATPLSTAISPFLGPQHDVYNRWDEFRSYSFGVQLEIPIANAAAKSQYADRQIARAQAELDHRELLSSVTLQVRRTVADVRSSRLRIDTTRVARQLAEENLRNQTKRHDVGMATTKDLLDFQTRLTTARAAEVQAQVDHAIALVRWRRAQGELLDHYAVVFDGPGKRSTPWFAMF